MRTLALIKRICKEMFRDKRTLALLFVAPLLILSLMYIMFNGDPAESKLGVVNMNDQLVKALEHENINVKQYEKITDANETVVKDDLDGLLQMSHGKLELVLKNSDPAVAKALQMKMNQIMASQVQAKLMDAKTTGLSKESVQTKYVYGNSKTVFFDILNPILVGFFVFFFVFLISGIGLLKERTTGTLERLMSTPIRRGEIVAAYLIGFGIFAFIQTMIIILFSVNVLNMVIVGSIWNVLLVNLLLALVALSLGTLLSAFASSEFQMIQFIPIVVVPQIFFSGIFPLEGMANWLQAIGKIMPLYYAADALKGVMYKGQSLNEISGDIFVLVVFAVIFIILNVFALKKYRTL